MTITSALEGTLKARASGRTQTVCRQSYLQTRVLLLPSLASWGRGGGGGEGGLRNVFISFAVIKPCCGLGTVSSRQTPISDVRPGCFDFAWDLAQPCYMPKALQGVLLLLIFSYVRALETVFLSFRRALFPLPHSSQGELPDPLAYSFKILGKKYLVVLSKH